MPTNKIQAVEAANNALAGNGVDNLLADIRQVLSTARTQIVRHVNTTLINAYWMVGKYIVEFEQGGKDRAEYSKGVIRYLAQNLTKEFGDGYTEANLRYMRMFYKRFPICHTVCDESQKGDALRDQSQIYDALCNNSQIVTQCVTI